MQLQEPIYDNRSQDVTARAMMWVQEQDVAAGVNMWLQEKFLKVVSQAFVTILDSLRFTVFWGRFTCFFLLPRSQFKFF